MEARAAALGHVLATHAASLSPDSLLDLLCNLSYDVTAACQKKQGYNKAAATRFLQSSSVLFEYGERVYPN